LEKVTLETSVEDVKVTLETSEEDVKITLETSGESLQNFQALFWLLLPLTVLISLTLISVILTSFKSTGQYWKEKFSQILRNFTKFFKKRRKKDNKVALKRGASSVENSGGKKLKKQLTTQGSGDLSPTSSKKKLNKQDSMDEQKISAQKNAKILKKSGTFAFGTTKKNKERHNILRKLRAKALLGEKIDLETLPIDIGDIPLQPSSAAR
jgi:hypothetical protein